MESKLNVQSITSNSFTVHTMQQSRITDLPPKQQGKIYLYISLKMTNSTGADAIFPSASCKRIAAKN